MSDQSVDLKKIKKDTLTSTPSSPEAQSALQQRTHVPWTDLFCFSNSLCVRMYNLNINRKNMQDTFKDKD